MATDSEVKTDPVKFKDVDETVTWTAQFPSGATAYCTASFKVGGIKNFRANCERGWFELDPAYYYGGIKGTRSDGKPLDAPELDQFATEMDDFADCIIHNRPTSVPGEMGLRDVRTMMALYESARTGRTVRLG
jgi:predicted dehydrogenase